MKRKVDYPLRDQQGTAIIIALVMMVVLTLIGLASTFTSTFDILLSGRKRGSTDAFYASDSGVQVVMSSVDYFNTANFGTDNKYNYSGDVNNPNPTKADIVINYEIGNQSAPRGLGMGTQHVGFIHFAIDSTGYDQTGYSSTASKCPIEQKVVRLVPLPEGE